MRKGRGGEGGGGGPRSKRTGWRDPTRARVTGGVAVGRKRSPRLALRTALWQNGKT